MNYTLTLLAWIGLDLAICGLFTWWMVKRAVWKIRVKERNKWLQEQEKHVPPTR
jgi:hypothetical protein